MCHLRMLDNQAFTKRRMSSDLIINAPPFQTWHGVARRAKTAEAFSRLYFITPRQAVSPQRIISSVKQIDRKKAEQSQHLPKSIISFSSVSSGSPPDTILRWASVTRSNAFANDWGLHRAALSHNLYAR